MKPEVIRLCTRRAILKDIHKDQMQAARTSWSLPTIVGGQYELESEQSMNTHQPKSKLPIPQNIMNSLTQSAAEVMENTTRRLIHKARLSCIYFPGMFSKRCCCPQWIKSSYLN